MNMGTQTIQKFLAAATTDRAIAEKVAALALESGYEFTAAELLEARLVQEISDAEIADATGGTGENGLAGPRFIF